MFVVITGHRGFIGSNLFRYLTYHGYTCHGIDIQDGRDILTAAIPPCDGIIHLAALAGVRKSHEDPEAYWKTNVEGSRRVFEHAEKWHAKLLYASSSSAKQWHTSPYATTKKTMEAMAPEKSIGMRFHTVYGLDSRPDMMYRKLLDNTAKYCTTHTRDFTSIKDLVRAIEMLFRSEDVEGVVDIGTGEQTKITDLVKASGRDLGPPIEVTGEQEYSQADTTIIKSLGWQPRYNVLDEIKHDLIQKDKMEKFSLDW